MMKARDGFPGMNENVLVDGRSWLFKMEDLGSKDEDSGRLDV